MKPLTNEFFDLNQLPSEEGILVMGISMNRIGNTQSAQACFDCLQFIDKKIIKTAGIGMVMLYGDYLCFHSEAPANILRDRYKELMVQHKHGLLKLLSRNTAWIQKAFSFYTFGQLMLDNSEVYMSTLASVQQLYATDKVFAKCVDEDVARSGKVLKDRGRLFILEEIVAFYLSSKGKLRFNNQFISGTEKWVLHLYPGKPLKSEVYLYQNNLLQLKNPQNPFEYCYYDLSSKLLYDYRRLDIDTFNFDEV